MDQPALNTQQTAELQEATPTPRRAWERPALQRLHVSLDTADGGGSNTDGLGGNEL